MIKNLKEVFTKIVNYLRKRTMATKAIYSHGYVTGHFNNIISPHHLNDRSIWKPVVLSPYDYQDYCTHYYKSHIDAMVEADGQGERPDFLNGVCHFVHTYKNDDSKGNGIKTQLNVKKKENHSYSFTLCAIHLYFFPLDFVLVSLEIDDSNTDLDEIAGLHYSLINWEESVKSADNSELIDLLSPLAALLPKKEVTQMIKEGTKMKMMQIIQIEGSKPDDSLLFELATFCPIGVVNGNETMTPSKSYFEKIISNHSISTFNNWKALALNDSFTVLSVWSPTKQENKPSSVWAWSWNNLYFPLIYLRCIFEKIYCQSRNSAYRQNKANNELAEEIAEMEKYYFYNNISYNFLPSLLYKKMAQSMGVLEERNAISNQIRDRLQEKQQHRIDFLLAILSVFAIISITWDLCSILKDAFWECCFADDIGKYLVFIAIALIIWLVVKIYTWRVVRSKIVKIGKHIKQYFNALIHRKRRIIIDNDTRCHVLDNHFNENALGSKFKKSFTIDSLLDEAQKLFSASFKHASTDPHDGDKIKLSLVFPYEIGYCNVVHINELDEEERNSLSIVQRGKGQAKTIKSRRKFPTKECQIILSQDWHLITMFPGEMAPPLPDSPDIHDEYWDNHVFVEPTS